MAQKLNMTAETDYSEANKQNEWQQLRDRKKAGETCPRADSYIVRDNRKGDQNREERCPQDTVLGGREKSTALRDEKCCVSCANANHREQVKPAYLCSKEPPKRSSHIKIGATGFRKLRSDLSHAERNHRHYERGERKC